jgi:hypothetical protein
MLPLHDDMAPALSIGTKVSGVGEYLPHVSTGEVACNHPLVLGLSALGTIVSGVTVTVDGTAEDRGEIACCPIFLGIDSPFPKLLIGRRATDLPVVEGDRFVEVLDRLGASSSLARDAGLFVARHPPFVLLGEPDRPTSVHANTSAKPSLQYVIDSNLGPIADIRTGAQVVLSRA